MVLVSHDLPCCNVVLLVKLTLLWLKLLAWLLRWRPPWCVSSGLGRASAGCGACRMSCLLNTALPRLTDG